ncbi:hypothetical protein [Streptomyces sp. enrichment culture]|uniref:hypothetical protein n=1 Tax=Streptomyces sp. enrichment culture TaxID=1795815 RepID=UPI003F55CBC3
MTDSTPCEPALEDSKPTSFTSKAKVLYQKHREKIHAVGGVVVSAALTAAVARLVEGRDVEDADEPSSLSPEAASEPRQSSPAPDRDPFLRRLPPGQRASDEARARYRELTGEELPDGYTVVRRWMYGKAA